MAKHSRYEVVQCLITGHLSYGLAVQTPTGQRGSIDKDVIGDRPLPVEDWPSVGQTISGVVMGYGRDGRLRVCAQPSYVSYVRSAGDINEIQEAWARVHRADREYVEATESLFMSHDARGVLRWALSRHPDSAEPGVALRALAHAPSGLVIDLMSELVALVVDGSREEEVHAVVNSVGVKISAPVLLRSIESLMARTVLTLQQYVRLAEFLISLGATRPLRVLIDKMLESGDPEIRTAGMRIQAYP